MSTNSCFFEFHLVKGFWLSLPVRDERESDVPPPEDVLLVITMWSSPPQMARFGTELINSL